MSPAELLIERAQASGITMRPGGGKLHLRAATPPAPELVEAIRVYKHEILEVLSAERDSNAIGCARPPERSRTCPSCGSGLQPHDGDRAYCGTCCWSMEHVAPRGVQ
ncbi:MAG TPA: hypothetical protein QGF05_05580 [Dehalococcoidia bacterium]|nr:hypothetical protein [Dehalococcoidia bacterium]